MPELPILPVVALLIVFPVMLVELRVSARHERALLDAGAVEPADDVYGTMKWVYPASFVAMALEGAVAGPPPRWIVATGAVVFVAGKALKVWAIHTLGPRWTFRVLVPPDSSLVVAGPYGWLRHPNYLGVLGELAGMALFVGAPLTGILAIAAFGALLRRRIAVEERALGLRR